MKEKKKRKNKRRGLGREEGEREKQSSNALKNVHKLKIMIQIICQNVDCCSLRRKIIARNKFPNSNLRANGS